MRIECAVHGVPLWLLQEYLHALGGEISEGTIRGAGWQAWLEKIEPYRIGSLSVGRVQLILEGEAAVVEPLFEKLGWKTLRGGG